MKFLILFLGLWGWQIAQAQVPYREERISTKMRLVKLLFDTLDSDTLPYTILVRGGSRDITFDLQETQTKAVSWCSVRSVSENYINGRPVKLDNSAYEIEVLLMLPSDTMKIKIYGLTESKFQLEGIVFKSGSYGINGWRRREPLFIEDWEEYRTSN